MTKWKIDGKLSTRKNNIEGNLSQLRQSTIKERVLQSLEKTFVTKLYNPSGLLIDATCNNLRTLNFFLYEFIHE
jgi:hypothetical protein